MKMKINQEQTLALAIEQKLEIIFDFPKYLYYLELQNNELRKV
jgi:hypothetical protein